MLMTVKDTIDKEFDKESNTMKQKKVIILEYR